MLQRRRIPRLAGQNVRARLVDDASGIARWRGRICRDWTVLSGRAGAGGPLIAPREEPSRSHRRLQRVYACSVLAQTKHRGGGGGRCVGGGQGFGFFCRSATGDWGWSDDPSQALGRPAAEDGVESIGTRGCDGASQARPIWQHGINRPRDSRGLGPNQPNSARIRTKAPGCATFARMWTL